MIATTNFIDGISASRYASMPTDGNSIPLRGSGPLSIPRLPRQEKQRAASSRATVKNVLASHGMQLKWKSGANRSEDSMLRNTGRVTTALLLATCLAAQALAITLNQVDDFEDGTEMGWRESSFSPNPPSNVASGGPGGVEDNYLQNISAGEFEGSRMIMFNTTQWSGNYLAAGVERITADMANLGSTDLAMRVALAKGTSPQFATWYVSADPVNLPASSGWTQASFGLSEDDLICINACGVSTLEDVLANVDMVRLLSATMPRFQGDQIAATLGVDNISALEAMEVVIGDMDCDGDTDFDDIDDFVLGLNDAAAYENMFGVPPSLKGDTDGDEDLDFDDIEGFVGILQGGGAVRVPEPASAAIAWIGIVALAGYGRALRRSSVASRGALFASARWRRST
jgi:hypothetical protein